MPAIVWGVKFPFSFSGLTKENERWVECMYPRGFLFGILVEIIISMLTTRLTCSCPPVPPAHEAGEAGGQAGRQTDTQTHRLTDRHSDRHTDTQTHRHIDTDTQTQLQTETKRCRETQAGRQARQWQALSWSEQATWHTCSLREKGYEHLTRYGRDKHTSLSHVLFRLTHSSALSTAARTYRTIAHELGSCGSACPACACAKGRATCFCIGEKCIVQISTPSPRHDRQQQKHA